MSPGAAALDNEFNESLAYDGAVSQTDTVQMSMSTDDQGYMRVDYGNQYESLGEVRSPSPDHYDRPSLR